MDLKEILKNTIPNPLSEQSTLSNLDKKTLLIEEGWSFTTLIRNVLFLLIAAFVLVVHFKISASIVVILVGTEVLITAATGYIRFRKIKSINAIETLDNAKSYRNLLITSEYYELIKAIFGFVANGVSVVLILLLFSREVSNIVRQVLTLAREVSTFDIQGIPIQTGLLKYSILIFVVFRGFDFIKRVIRYKSIKNLKESDDYAQMNQEYELMVMKFGLMEYIPWMGVILLILFLIKIPLFFPLIFGGLMFLMVVLSLIELQRLKNIDFNNKEIDATVVQHAILEYVDEQIAGSVFGIMKVTIGFKDLFKPRVSYAFGTGKNFYPENSLLVTNHRILLIQVPMTGGNKIVGNVDYVLQNFLFNRGEIKQKGEEILKTNSLPQILKLATNDVLFNDIKALSLPKGKIIIEKISGEKLGYAFMDLEQFDLLKQLLQPYLKERFTVV